MSLASRHRPLVDGFMPKFSRVSSFCHMPGCPQLTGVVSISTRVDIEESLYITMRGREEKRKKVKIIDFCKLKNNNRKKFVNIIKEKFSNVLEKALTLKVY